jgi:hypothetical protein
LPCLSGEFLANALDLATDTCTKNEFVIALIARLNDSVFPIFVDAPLIDSLTKIAESRISTNCGWTLRVMACRAQGIIMEKQPGLCLRNAAVSSTYDGWLNRMVDAFQNLIDSPDGLPVAVQLYGTLLRKSPELLCDFHKDTGHLGSGAFKEDDTVSGTAKKLSVSENPEPDFGRPDLANDNLACLTKRMLLMRPREWDKRALPYAIPGAAHASPSAVEGCQSQRDADHVEKQPVDLPCLSGELLANALDLATDTCTRNEFFIVLIARLLNDPVFPIFVDAALIHSLAKIAESRISTNCGWTLRLNAHRALGVIMEKQPRLCLRKVAWLGRMVRAIQNLIQGPDGRPILMQLFGTLLRKWPEPLSDFPKDTDLDSAAFKEDDTISATMKKLSVINENIPASAPEPAIPELDLGRPDLANDNLACLTQRLLLLRPREWDTESHTSSSAA